MRDYCLQLMGVVEWQERVRVQKEVLLILNEPLTQAMDQLLLRMLQALNWLRISVQIEQVEKLVANHFLQFIQNSHYKKIVLFGENIAPHLSLSLISNPLQMEGSVIVALPTLSEMLTNINAKKRAWELLRSYAAKAT